MAAIGVELSTDADMAAIAVASRDGGRWLADVTFYGSPDDVVAECSRQYLALPECCGVFLDALPCAGILADLKAEVWVHVLSVEEVAASAWQYVTEIRNRRGGV